MSKLKNKRVTKATKEKLSLKKMRKRVKELDNKVFSLSVELRELKNTVNDLKGDLKSSPLPCG